MLKFTIKEPGYIKGRVLLSGKSKYFDTGLKTDISKWDKTEGMVKGLDPINLNLMNLKKKYDDILADFQVEQTIPDIETVITKLQQKAISKTVYGVIRDILIDTEKNSIATYNRVSSSYSYLKSFFESDIPITEVKPDFWKRFHDKAIQDYSVNTYNLMMTHYKPFIREMEKHTSYVEIIKEKQVKSEFRYLTRDKLEQVKQIPDSYIKDLFLLQCHTGLAYVDILKFNKSNIITDKSGLKLIEFVRTKTEKKNSKPVRQPLWKEVDLIMSKYEWNLPYISLSNYNRGLEKIGKSIGVEISSHVGRHTFATLKLEEGWDLKEVSVMLGHTSVLTTERVYSFVTNDKILNKFRKINNNNL